MRSTTTTNKWRSGRRRTFATLGASALVVSMAMLGGPIIGSAGADSPSSITYTVNPIAIQLTSASKPSQVPTPGQCIAGAGLACYTPQILHTAYQVPWTIDGQLAGTGEQVAIVDAFGSPTIASDLAIYDSEFGLPAANLHVYYPDGPVTYSPMARKGLQTGWAEETSLDVE